MRKNAFNAKEHIPAINKFRIAMNGKSFTTKELLDVFRENNIPSNATFWSVFRKSGIIKEVGKGQYVFASNEPVFYGELGKVYRQYHTIRKKYAKPNKPVEKPREKDEFDHKEALQVFEVFAIDFLKEIGYKIMAPVGTVYKEI